MKIEEKDISQRKAAVINHTGKLADMAKLNSKLMICLMKSKVEVVGHLFAIYHTSPQEVDVDKMNYDLGIPIKGDIDCEEIKMVQYPPQKVLSFTHVGSYSKLGEVYANALKYIIAKRIQLNGDPYEIYINNPQDFAEDELITEIQFPINERKFF
jgi:AraC family transcriptional regulator